MNVAWRGRLCILGLSSAITAVWLFVFVFSASLCYLYHKYVDDDKYDSNRNDDFHTRMRVDKTNKENLEAIERCIFVLCLDSSTPMSFSSRSPDGACDADRPLRDDVSLAEQMIHGHGSSVNSANRWFEKTMQVKKTRIQSRHGNYQLFIHARTRHE